MSFMQFTLDVPEPEILAAGTEARLRIVDARTGISEKGNSWLRLRLAVMSHPKAEELSEIFTLPTDAGEERSNYRRQLRLKRFTAAVGCPPAEFTSLEQLEEWAKTSLVGREFWATLRLEDGGEEYGPQNRLGLVLRQA